MLGVDVALARELYVVTLKTGQLGYGVKCVFPKAAKAQVTSLETEQAARITGFYGGLERNAIPMWIRLVDCELAH